jgi:hypothetical protein
MAESGIFEQVVNDIVARLVRDLDDVIALIQRPIASETEFAWPDVSDRCEAQALA